MALVLLHSRKTERTMARKSIKTYLPMVCAAFAIGAMPALVNLTVDPYQLFFAKDRSTKVNDVAEKKHYPLWKLAKFKRNTHDTIILGDSRARALRDKYWHDLKVPGQPCLWGRDPA